MLLRSTGAARRTLSSRELEILNLIAEGMTNRQIGEQLLLAEKTVKNYVSGLLAKLGMKSRIQAAVLSAETRGKDRSHVA
ncbi:MAG: response regulator transcription factor [Sporichthya sp.]|nr:response regulator transcription factor [Sporichthya sp.]